MMKALRIHDDGTAEVLCYEDAPTPQPGPREILVRVHAAGANPADRQIREDPRHTPEKPFALTLGCEVSGIVEKRGAEVTELAVGDEVYGSLLRLGGYAEYAVESASNLSRKPASMDHVQAAALRAVCRGARIRLAKHPWPSRP